MAEAAPIAISTLARRIKGELQRELRRRNRPTRVSCRPYNRHNPDSSPWWLIPSTKWPAPAFGKIILEPTETGLFVGLNVEKGLPLQVASDLGCPRHRVMDRDWAWYKVVDDMRNGVLDGFARTIHSRTGFPVVVRVGFEPFGAATRSDEDGVLEWEVTETALVQRKASLMPEASILSSLATANNLSQLGNLLANLTGHNFYWGDLRLGVCIEGRRTNEGLMLCIHDANWIIDNCVVPWINWFC